MPPDDHALEAADRAARARALDVSRSFLVQAPAGSGKTGLLIARMLALLAVADRPEAILAITFTRKAAAEMRERVLQALREADAATPVDPTNAHEAVMRALATAALARSAASGWNLLVNPSRLRMITIDALATGLNRQIPLTTGLGAPTAYIDDATAHYREAVGDALAAAEVDDPHWRTFLAHVDNDAESASTLLAGMLARREQWLRQPAGHGADNLRELLEAALRREVDDAIGHVVMLMPPALAKALTVHQRYAAPALHARAPELTAALEVLAGCGGLPPADAAALEAWCHLANWLLVKNGADWRKRADVNLGFPAKGTGAGANQREAAKQAMQDWLSDVGQTPGLAEALDAVRKLPPPYYSEASWAFVAATLALLPLLAARLALVFSRRGEIDFAEATLRALAALGDAASPGDLLLAADLRFAHILVDEFQDTSASQIELLERLTAGWEEGDGRTLFAVGDPMQSIYRFREAEVRFFLDAQISSRVARIPVECLRLARNFRSQETVIDWVNEVFPAVLAPASDPERSEVAYEHVLATRHMPGDRRPTLDVVVGEADEAQAVVARVREALDGGSRDIAILVRARTHLASILPALRRAGIAYEAVDLESLARHDSTRDLLTLVRVLVQPNDEVAALALLRAPWCGLTLGDLVAMMEARVRGTLLDSIEEGAIPATVSADGRMRLRRLREALGPALASRGRVALGSRVRAAWLALGGPACGDGEDDLAATAKLFALLSRHERGGDIAEWDEFAAAAAKLYAQSSAVDVAPVQVMTLHKAKGLEFDTVIMPGLARAGARSDDPPLRWKRRGGSEEDARLLLAPMRARIGARAGAERDPVYRYLQALDAEEGTAELGRLLYVGCTRARRALHLVASLDARPNPDDGSLQWAKPRSTSALARLWPVVEAWAGAPAAAQQPPAAEGQAPQLRRLPLDWRLPAARDALITAPAIEEGTPATLRFDWAQATAAAVGTVAHRLLAQLHRDGLTSWTQARLTGERPRIRAELAREGVSADGFEAAAQSVHDVLAATLGDTRGRWLFAPEHADAHSEWALAGLEEGEVVRLTLDRSFVVDEIRYIVDFKTGRHEGGDTDAFLAREVERYRPQLERYARILRGIDPRPIRLALYYPRVPGGWREWPANPP